MNIPIQARADQYLLKLRSPELLAKWCSEQGVEPLTRDMVLVTAPSETLLLSSGIEYAEPNHLYRRHRDQESPRVPREQWALHNEGQNGGKLDADIDAPEAWTDNTGQVLVAVLDTGMDIHHPDLRHNLYRNEGEVEGDGIDNDGNGVIDDVHGYNAAENTGDPWSDDPHGTHCGGTIAANGKVLGVAPTAKILPIQIFDEDDWTDAATIIRALDYARKAGAKIASHSYGGLSFNRAVKEMLEQSDMLHVVAAGNYSSNNDKKENYPSSYQLPNLISVAASDRRDKLADFSNFGPKSVHLAAPGVDILSTTSYGNHGSWSGTSMAAPHVAGAAALVATKFSEEGPLEWKERLLSSVDVQPGWESKVSTGGRLNAARALGLEVP